CCLCALLPPRPTLFPYTTLFRSLFARLLAEETAGAGKLPVTIGGALGAGKTEGGTYVIAVIDITDKDGKPLHRLLNETTLSGVRDRKSTRLNSSHVKISYAVFCL